MRFNIAGIEKLGFLVHHDFLTDLDSEGENPKSQGNMRTDLPPPHICLLLPLQSSARKAPRRKVAGP